MVWIGTRDRVRGSKEMYATPRHASSGAVCPRWDVTEGPALAGPSVAVSPARFERATPGLGIRCSIQLSYGDIRAGI